MSVQIYSCSAFLKMHLQSEKSLNNHKIPEHLHFLARLSKQRWDRGIRQSSRWKPFWIVTNQDRSFISMKKKVILIFPKFILMIKQIELYNWNNLLCLIYWFFLIRRDFFSCIHLTYELSSNNTELSALSFKRCR